MDRLQFENRFDKLTENIQDDLKKEAMRLLDSGAVNMESYENNYLLPKIVLTVALQNQADQVSPVSWDTRAVKEVRNLTKF